MGGGWHHARSHSSLERGRRTPTYSSEVLQEIEGRQPERGGGEEERKVTAERGTRETVERNSVGSLMGAGAPAEKGLPVEWNWPGGGGGERRARIPGEQSGVSRAASPRPGPGRSQPQCLRGPTLRSLGCRYRDERHRQRQGGGGRLEPVWPAPAVSHSHLILVYRLHQLAPRVEVGASPKTGAPALQ